jgi:hypothetical protein
MNKQKYYYLEIQGNCEEEADEIALTTFAYYKAAEDKTMIKVYFDGDKRFKGTVCAMYADFGDILRVELMEI